MKCSKCGHDNPEDALFCEECDWKMGETYVPEVKIDRSITCYLALVIGIAAIACMLLNLSLYSFIVLGAIGLMVGGYSFSVPMLLGKSNKTFLMAISAVGLGLSVISFIYGIYLLA